MVGVNRITKCSILKRRNGHALIIKVRGSKGGETPLNVALTSVLLHVRVLIHALLDEVRSKSNNACL